VALPFFFFDLFWELDLSLLFAGNQKNKKEKKKERKRVEIQRELKKQKKQENIKIIQKRHGFGYRLGHIHSLSISLIS